jgi:putative Holliday junction resolvase
VSAAALSGTVLGFDFGEKRIGVAVGETATRLAHAVETIEGEANDARFARIAELVAEWRPALLVVGRPRHADGAPHAIAALAERFARRLEGRFALPVRFVDESYTSVEAGSLLGRNGRVPRRAPGEIDRVAAQLIVQSFLDGGGDAA